MPVRVQLRRDAGKVDPRTTAWIRARQVARVLGPPDPSAVAELVDHRGRVLGHGLYSPESAIVLRLLSAGEHPPPPDWLDRRLAAALRGRALMGLGAESATTGYREVNSEGDGLPGLVVDRYGDWRVAQITTAPMAARRAALAAALARPVPGDPSRGGLIILAPSSAATREGFEPGVEILAADGSERGPDQLEWREHGLQLTAPAPPSQKTGAYHDQRDNRSRFAALVAGREAPRVLDLGCHVGGFALAAAARGAEVVAVDRSASALEFVARNAAQNGLTERIQTVEADMFGALDELEGSFDAVVFDPPKIASSRRDLERAIGALTRTLARLRARLSEAGILALCSCSHHLGWDALDRAMLDASAGARLTRLARWGPGPDHPIAPGHDEGQYLRVAVFRCS